MKIYTKLIGGLLILIALYYLRWFLTVGDVVSALVGINLLAASLLLLSLPGDKWNVRPWFKDTRYGCKWPINGSGWSVSISLIVAMVLTLLIADSSSDVAHNTVVIAVPFVGTIIASWIAIQHIRS